MILQATCQRCRRQFDLNFEPSEFITERTALAIAICNKCAGVREPNSKPKREGNQLELIPAPVARLPYPND